MEMGGNIYPSLWLPKNDKDEVWLLLGRRSNEEKKSTSIKRDVSQGCWKQKYANFPVNHNTLAGYEEKLFCQKLIPVKLFFAICSRSKHFYWYLFTLLFPFISGHLGIKFDFYGFCSNRLLLYFPLSVRPRVCVCHRRDISHFSRI